MGCHFLLQGIFPTQGSNLTSTLAGRFFTTEPPGKPDHTLEHSTVHLHLLQASSLCNLSSMRVEISPSLDSCSIPNFYPVTQHIIGPHEMLVE